MSELTFENTVTTDDYFGGCPECGCTDGYMNISRNHWFVCDEHRTKWLVGSNLFSSWREEGETIWRQNWERLLSYREVKPVLPDYPDREQTDAFPEFTTEELPF